MPTPLAIDVIGPMDEHSGSGAMRQMLSNSPKPMFAVVVACQTPLRARGLVLPVCPFGLVWGTRSSGMNRAREFARVCVGVCVAGGSRGGGGTRVRYGSLFGSWVSNRLDDGRGRRGFDGGGRGMRQRRLVKMPAVGRSSAARHPVSQSILGRRRSETGAAAGREGWMGG